MRLRRVISFGVVGGVVFVGAQLLLYILVDYLYWSPQVANIVTLILSVWVNYELNQRITWKHVSRESRQVQRFVMSRLATLALSALVFNVLIIAFGIHYLVANVVGVIVGMVVNFVVSDKWVFIENPRTSNLKLTWRTAAKTIVLIAGVVLAAWAISPGVFFSTIFTGLAVIAIAAVCLNLIAGLYVHRNESSWRPAPRPADLARSFENLFAVLMPARKEGRAYGLTIINAAVTQRDHPGDRFFSVTCDDDPSTTRVALVAARVVNRAGPSSSSVDELSVAFLREWASIADPRAALSDEEWGEIHRFALVNAPVQIVIFPLNGQSPSKPKQLNYAFGVLEHDGFTAFTILDAESMAQPGLFTYADYALQANPDAAVVQGAVQLMDPPLSGGVIGRNLKAWGRWFSWHNLLEYHRWFSGQMAFQSDNEFVPLGGNTLFVRTEVLAKTHGWPLSLTEDCALGVQISAELRGKVVVFYDPALATREETPHTVRDLVKQRTRWTQGFLESFVAGQWQAMPTAKQRFLAFWILSNPFFQAIAVFLLPLAVLLMVTGILKSPVVLVLVMFIPILLSILVVALQVEQLYDFGRTYRRRIPFAAYVIIVTTQPLYQWLLSLAALRAAIRHFTGQISWQSPARSEDLVANFVSKDVA